MPAPRSALSRALHYAVRLGVPAFLIVIVTWPTLFIAPIGGLDPSWELGLQMGFMRGFHYTDQLAFTYGPLGFAKTIWAGYAETLRIGFVYQLALQSLFAVVLFWSTRRTWGTVAGFVIAVLAASFLFDDPMIALSVLAAVAVMADRGIDPGRWFAPAAGAVAGVEALGKVSIGIIVFVVFLIAVVFADERRREGILTYLGAFAASFLVFWLLLGQTVSGIWGYLLDSISFATGYAGAMATESPSTQWQYWTALVAAIIVLGGGWASTRNVSGRARTGVMLILAFVIFTTFKEGFVRHHGPTPGAHATAYFSVLLVIVVGLPWSRDRLREALLSAAVLAVATFGIATSDPSQIIRPLDRPEAMWNQFRLTFDAGKRDAVLAAGRAAMQAGYALDAPTLALLTDKSVHVQPWEAGVVYAYKLDWLPAPIFQMYAAYTPRLDGQNADVVASPRGPERILRQPQPGGIDTRIATFDAPQESLATLCNFRSIHVAGAWQVVSRVPDRCGTPVTLGTVHTTWGAPVRVPAPGRGRLIVADVQGAGVEGLERIQSLAFRPDDRYALLNGTTKVKLTTPNIGSGLLLRSPPAADYPAPFNVAVQTPTISFLRGNGAQSGGDITITFKAIPISGRGVAAP